MRSIICIFVIAAVLVSAAAAFAQDRVGVNVPFSFETHGKIFPAGTYEVDFDQKLHALKLSSQTDTKMIYIWRTVPTECDPDVSELSLRFDHAAMERVSCAAFGLRSGRRRYWAHVIHTSLRQTPGQ
jgi:hypothetical protein